MSANSAIEWTDATWSPTLGCTRVSDGCDHCYAMRTVHRMSFNPNEKVAAAAANLTAYRPGVGVVWTNLVRMLPDRLDLPLRWRKPRRVFVDSQSDLFHDQVSDEFIARVFAVMAWTPRHTYQILTKRHARMRSLLNSAEFQRSVRWFHDVRDDMPSLRYPASDLDFPAPGDPNLPLPNVWLGVSVEDQKWASIRIPALLETPAAVRFLSCEPLLDEVNLSRWLDTSLTCGCGAGPAGSPDAIGCCAGCMTPEPSGIDWIIAGGESGSGARLMDPDWVRLIRDQCAETGTPFLFKQWGGYTAKAGGRELDGRTWDEYPAVTA